MPGVDVAVVGANLASLFASLTLRAHGLSVAVVQTGPPQHDLGVLWPGLTEHWGMLAGTLGEGQCEALIRAVARSRDLLMASPAWGEAHGRRGAVMQLACNRTEMEELTVRLRWLNDIWPRRLMSAGAASNYLTVNEIEGAAYVPDCCACQPLELQVALLQQARAAGIEVWHDSQAGVGDGFVTTSQGRIDCEMVLVASGWTSLDRLAAGGRWLFSQCGVVFGCESVSEPWNPSLVGIESHRGHLMLAHPWQISGISPEGDGHDECQVDTRLIEILSRLAGERITCLESVITTNPRPVVYTCTADSLPAVGPLRGGRQWLLAGFAGRALSLGPALGEQVALAILGQSAPLLEAAPCLRPARFLAR